VRVNVCESVTFWIQSHHYKTLCLLYFQTSIVHILITYIHVYGFNQSFNIRI